MSDAQKTIQGKCLCGGVEFEVTPPAIWCAHCHCSMCRRAHGAPFVTWVGFEEGRVRVLSGDDLLVHFQATPQATRTFCRKCGSQLFFQGDRWPGELHVARALLEDGAPLVPTGHSFFSDKAPWVTIHDDLPKRGGPAGTELLDET